MTGAQLKSVIVGVPDCRLQSIAAEVGSQRCARSIHLSVADGIVDRVLAASAAGQRAGLHLGGLAEAEAKRGIARIRLDQHALATAGCAYITGAENCLRAGLPLD